jgi:cobaltochelatase CobN
MKITILTSEFHARLADAARFLPDVRVKAYSGRALRDAAIRAEAGRDLRDADICLVFASDEPFWEELHRDYLAPFGKDKPLIWLSYEDEGSEAFTTLKMAAAREAGEYIRRGGPDNALYLLRYLAGLVRGDLGKVPPPESVPAFALWHPEAPEKSYPSLGAYQEWYSKWYSERHSEQSSEPDPKQSSERAVPRAPKGARGTAGLILGRYFWAIDKPVAEEALIAALEKEGLMVLPVFVSGDDFEESKLALKFMEEVFLDVTGESRVDVLIKLTSLYQGGGAGVPGGSGDPYDILGDGDAHAEDKLPGDDSPARSSVRFFRKINRPVLQPVVSYGQSLSEWEKNPQGVASELAWSVVMPEFEGAIEPFFIAGSEKGEAARGAGSPRAAHPERIRRLAGRVRAWASLGRKKP